MNHSFPIAATCCFLIASSFTIPAQASGYDDQMMSVVATVDVGANFRIVLHDAHCNPPNERRYRFLAMSRSSGMVAQGCWYFDPAQNAVSSTLETGQHGNWPIATVKPAKGMDLNRFTLMR